MDQHPSASCSSCHAIHQIRTNFKDESHLNFGHNDKIGKIINKKNKVGDHVRISKTKLAFEKGYTANWSIEIFVVAEILHTQPITYKIKDQNVCCVRGVSGIIRHRCRKKTRSASPIAITI